MRTIAILNFKGGVGKTVTTATLAYLGAKSGRRLLLIDADSQGNLSMAMGVDAEAGGDTLELLKNGAGYYPDFVTKTKLPGVDIIPADIRLLTADVDMAQRSAVRNEAIAELRNALEEDDAYDAVLIDCPPALSAACVAALTAASEVLIPIRLDRFSTGGMANLAAQVAYMRELNPRLRISGVLVTQYMGTAEEREALRVLRDGPLPVFEAVIRYSRRVPAATFSPDPLPVFSPGCSASRDYKTLAAEIWGGAKHEKSEFNIADVLGRQMEKVSGSDTEMRWIDTFSILSNSLNFYPRPNNAQLEELMESIQANGLLEPPTVVPTDEKDTYRLISGHSRMEAVRMLQTTPGGERWDKVLCRVLPPMDKDRELTAVIEANRQRTKTPALLAQEAEKLTAAYVARKKAGEDLPGRIRDRVAKDMQLSATKLANLKTIKAGLKVPGFQEKWSLDQLTESAALLIAQMDVDRQYRLLDWTIDHHKPLTVAEIRKFDVIWTSLKHSCPETAGLCPNAERMYDTYFHHGEWSCPGCCRSCLKRDTCRVACAHCGKKAPEAKPVETAKNPALDDPRLDSDRMVSMFCRRLTDLRVATGLSRKEFAESVNYFQATYSAWEHNSLPGTTNVPRLALALGVTTDYLFGLTDEPDPSAKPEGQLVISGWMPGGTTPAEPGYCATLIDLGADGYVPKLLRWDGSAWTFGKPAVKTVMKPSWWMRLPDEPEKPKT